MPQPALPVSPQRVRDPNKRWWELDVRAGPLTEEETAEAEKSRLQAPSWFDRMLAGSEDIELPLIGNVHDAAVKTASALLTPDPESDVFNLINPMPVVGMAVAPVAKSVATKLAGKGRTKAAKAAKGTLGELIAPVAREAEGTLGGALVRQTPAAGTLGELITAGTEVLPEVLETGTIGQLTGMAPKVAGTAASRLGAVTETLAPLAPEQKAAVVEEILSAYPVTDAYTKPTHHLSPKMLASRAATLSPEAQQVVQRITENLDPSGRIAPAEVQSIVQGRPYVPSRVVRQAHRGVAGAEPLPGAPYDVTTKAHELTRLRNYLSLVREGLDGWDWYDKGGRAIMFAANDNPEFARQIAEVLSVTSSATGVDVNTGFGVKAIQSRGKDPSGRYPAAMGKKIRGVLADEEFASGKKHTAFADALSRAGGFMSKHSPERPVNDIWQAEAWGYQNPDGTPLRRGWTDAEHAWMDRMSDRALAAVLRDPKLAALIPPEAGTWTLPRLQAAAWVGQKRRAEKAAAAADALAGKTNSGAAQIGRVGEFGAAIQDTYAQQGREFTPARRARHMTELQGDTPEAARLRQEFQDLMIKEGGIYDDKMRDQIMAKMGGMTGPSFEGEGIFNAVFSPGVQTQAPVGTSVGPQGGRIIAPHSMERLRASDAIYALHNAQAATAGGKVLPAGTGQIRDAANVTLKTGQVNKAQMIDVLRLVEKHGGKPSSVVPIPTPQGIRLYNVPGKDQMPEKAFRKLVRDVHTAHGKGAWDEDAFIGKWSGYFDTNKWNLHGSEFGQGYYPLIEPFAEEYDTFAPQLATLRMAAEKEMGSSITRNPTQVYLHKTVEGEGWRGLMKLSREYGIPVVLLASMAGLEFSSEDVEEVAQ